MARPQKEGLDYFPHDTFTDDKIEAMEAKYGLAGHAFYFKLCERIYRTSNGELDLTDADTVKTIAKNFHISVRRFDEMLEYSLKKQLFDQQLFENTKRLSSNGIKKRKNNVINKRVTERQRYSESKLNDGIPATETTQKPIVSAEFLPLNKSKVNKSKVNIPLIVPQGTLRSKNTEIKQTGAVVAGNQVTSGENPPSRTKFVLPDWIKPETWSAFKEMRQKSRAPLTGSAAKLLLHKLDRFRADGDDPNLVLEQSIMSGYRGVFALKQGQASPAKKGGNFGRSNGDQKPDTETPEQHMQRLKDSINKPF